MRESFVFYRSFAESVRNLPAEEYKKVMQSILDYALDDIEPQTSGIEYTVFCLVKPQIDANNKRYENGKKGGRPKASDNQDVTNNKPNHNQDATNQEPKHSQSITKAEPNVNVNDNVNIKKSSKELKEKHRFSPPTAEEVKAYCEEKGYKVDSDRFVDFYASKDWMVGRNKMKDWRAAVRNWARKDSTGCAVHPTQQSKESKFRNFEEREYDMDQLTRDLIGG